MSHQILLLFDCGVNRALSRFTVRALTAYYDSEVNVKCVSDLLTMARIATQCTFDGIIPVPCVSIAPDDTYSILTYNEFSRYWPAMPIMPLEFYYLDAYAHGFDTSLAVNGKWRTRLRNAWRPLFKPAVTLDPFIEWMPISQFLPTFSSDAVFDVNQQLVDMWDDILNDWPAYSWNGVPVFVRQLPERFEQVPALWSNQFVLLDKEPRGKAMTRVCCSRELLKNAQHYIGWELPDDLQQ